MYVLGNMVDAFKLPRRQCGYMVISFMDFACVDVLLEGIYGLSVSKSRPAGHDYQSIRIFLFLIILRFCVVAIERSKKP